MLQIQTTGKNFSPAAYLDQTPDSFVWNWSDGSTSTAYPIASVSFGNSGSRTQYLTVDPIGCLTNFNIGYDASDGGDTNNLVKRPSQNVRAVYFLQPLTNLQYWASAYAPITNVLDFSGFVGLQDIECWHCTNLQHVVATNLPHLRRLCVEACDLEELDISGNPGFEDLRAALNSYTSVKVGGGTGPAIWHFCVRDNPQITQQFASILTNFYSLREPWFWNANQSGALHFVSTNLTDVEVFKNQYSSADFTGQSNMVTLLIYQNALTNLTLDGCTGLETLQAESNLLPSGVIDAILTFLDTSCTNISYVDLRQNSFPTGIGYSHYLNLASRGVQVYLDLPASSAPVLSADSSRVLAETCWPWNGSIDPGETVTVAFGFKNTGIRSTTNLIVTLLETNGVLSPSGPQNYGALLGALPTEWPFTFTVQGSCGTAITPTFQLRDGPATLTNLSIPLLVGAPVEFFREDFDSVSAPNLPKNWSTSGSETEPAWTTSAAASQTGSTAAFSPSVAAAGSNELVSPPITLATNFSRLVFANSYDLEADAASGYDGGVLEIKIGSGTFVDILSAGGSFAANGYTRTLSSSYGNPLGGRPAWSGNSGGFLTTVVDLPASAAGQVVQFRWRCASDSNNASRGWFIDSVVLTSPQCCDLTAPLPPPVVRTLFVTNGLANLSGFAVPGKTYRLQYIDDITATNWTDIVPDISPGSTNLSITGLPADSDKRFYRLVQLP